MSVSDGQKVNAAVTNAAFMSRTTDTNTTGKVDLENTDAASGNSVINAQKEHNSSASYTGKTLNTAKDDLPTWTDTSVGSPTDNLTERAEALTVEAGALDARVTINEADIAANAADIADIRTTTGTVDGDTDMGTYTAGTNGYSITNNQTTKQNIQDLVDGVDSRIALTEKGVADGVATLDSGGRLPASQLPTSATEYKGAWDASTNSPTLSDGSGTNGDLYRVSVAGIQDLGSGSESYGIGDAVIYNGSIWQKIPADDAVTSVNGQSGIVVLDTDDISEGATNLYFSGKDTDDLPEGAVNEYYTDTKVDARIALASIDDLSDVDTSTVAPTSGQALSWDGSNWVPSTISSGGSGVGAKNYIASSDSKFEEGVSASNWEVYDDGGSFVDGTGGSPSVLTISDEADSLVNITYPAPATANTSFGPLATFTNLGQSFTPSQAFTANSAGFDLFNVTSATGNIRYELYATDGSGLPTGAALAQTANIDVSLLPTIQTGLYTASFITPVLLSASVKYAVVIIDVSLTNDINFGRETTDVFAGGNLLRSTTSGASWTNAATNDAAFIVSGDGVGLQLEGDISLKLSKSASDATGEGISVVSTIIDREDFGRPLPGSLEVDFTDANYTSNDLVIKAYDVTNSAELYVQTDSGILNGQYRHNFVVYPSSDTDQVRVALHMDTDSATGSAWNGIIDDVKCGPSYETPGAIIQEVKTLALDSTYFDNDTGLGVDSSFSSAKVARVGNQLIGHIQFRFTGDGTDAAELRFNLDLVLTNLFGVTYIDLLSVDKQLSGSVYKIGTGARGILVPTTIGVDRIVFYSDDSAGPILGTNSGTSSGRFRDFNFNVILEVAEWKASASLSTTENLLKSVLSKYGKTSAQSIGTGTWETIAFNTTKYSIATSISSGQITFPIKGKYTITARNRFSSFATGGRVGIRVLKNGATEVEVQEDNAPSGSFAWNVNLSVTDEFAAGDYIEIQALQDSGVSQSLDVSNENYNSVDIKLERDLSVFSVYSDAESNLISSSGFIAYPIAANTYGDLTSITLDPGAWRLTAHMNSNNIGAVTAGDEELGISTTPGNSSTGLVYGVNRFVRYNDGLTTSYGNITIASYDVDIIAPTTFYLKAIKLNATTNLQWAYSLRYEKRTR